MNKRITVQCHRCGELVEIVDNGFYWAMCDKCEEEYEDDLEKDLLKEVEL